MANGGARALGAIMPSTCRTVGLETSDRGRCGELADHRGGFMVSPRRITLTLEFQLFDMSFVPTVVVS